MARRALERLVEVDASGIIRLSASTRLKLAQEASRLGAFQGAARGLTWQEFEGFGEDCLSRADFATQRGVVFNEGKKRWQIDIVAIRGQVMLAFDCKHWESPNYISRFNRAIEHHKNSLMPLIRHTIATRRLVEQNTWALSVILTLFEPRVSIMNDVVLLSIGQLPDFLEHLTPFDPDLPFTAIGPAESPIS